MSKPMTVRQEARFTAWLNELPNPALKRKQSKQLADACDQYLMDGGEVEHLPGPKPKPPGEYARRMYLQHKTEGTA